MPAQLRSVGLALVLMAALVTPGCTTAAKCVGQQAWKGADGVCNTEGHFAYGGSKTNHTATETYNWTNPSSEARVFWGGDASGNLTIRIADANGTTVFEDTVAGGKSIGSEATSTGAPGQWQIELAFEDFDGDMGLSIQATNGTGS